MRKITTAVTSAALALSMLAQGMPTAAVTGYDSSYAGESAFVNITTGQTQNFQVFFANTGTLTWVRGSSTQVDLAACLEDKVSCNLQDATEAGWNTGWLSAVRYATTTQSSVSPGSLGTFSYNVTAPVGAANGIYRFNGDLVVASTGERIHPEGYYQEANLGGVAGGAATITDLDPDEGSTAGGDSVVITGTGIQCTPAFPSVSFGGTAAPVVSCGSTSVTVTSPAHAEGTVAVTLTNSGASASNSLNFDYNDEDPPVFTSMTVSGDIVTVTFSEPVCRATLGTEATDWTVNNISSGGLSIAVTGDTIPDDCDDAATTADLILAGPVANGAFVETTLNDAPDGTTSNVNITDAAANAADAPQARQATATAPETTEPDLVSASGNVSSSTITLTFSEPVYCSGLTPATEITVEDEDGNDITVAGYGSDPCDVDRFDADSSFNISIAPADIEADLEYTVTISTTDATNVRDVRNNSLDNNDATFTAGAGDFTPPTMVDARVSGNVLTTDFAETDDAFTLTFSEVMDTDTDDSTIQIQDQDGTVYILACGGTPATEVNSVTCEWNDTDTVVTVTLEEAATVPGLGADGAGNTPGMQIPFNVTTLTNFADAQGNVPNVLGSSDRLVDYE
jgi:hypothetical protein